MVRRLTSTSAHAFMMETVFRSVVIASIVISPPLSEIAATDGLDTLRRHIGIAPPSRQRRRTRGRCDAVGPTGMVYAVDVTDRTVETLRHRANALGYANVVVVKGELGDPCHVEVRDCQAAL